MKSKKSVLRGLVLVACAFGFSACTTTTRVIEVKRNVTVRSAPTRTIVYTSSKPAAKAPPPSEFRVVNEYDQR